MQVVMELRLFATLFAAALGVVTNRHSQIPWVLQAFVASFFVVVAAAVVAVLALVATNIRQSILATMTTNLKELLATLQLSHTN